MNVGVTVDFNILWSQYELELTNFVRARLFDKSLAHDIMQDVAIKVYKNQDEFQKIDNIRAWLYKITRNTLIDFYKQNNKKIPNELYSQELITHSNNENLESSELASCLRYMMSSSLNQSDKDVLNYSIVEEYSIKEISLKTKLTSEGVKTKLKRAKKKLASKFFSCCNLEKDTQGNILDYKANKDSICGC